jgi:hypothetical protein
VKSAAITGIAKAEARAATSSLFLSMVFPFFDWLKWDKSIHANLSAETVPATESRANTGFATWHAKNQQEEPHQLHARKQCSAPEQCTDYLLH